MADADYTDHSRVCSCGGHITKTFKSGKPGKFCNACMESNAPKVKKVRPKNTLTCVKCGADFLGPKGKKYCSDSCRIFSGNKAQRDARIAISKTNRTCAFCGVKFSTEYGDFRTKYCSRKCRKSYEYKTRSGSTNRRRARKFGVVFRAVNKYKVFDRDGWRCQICGKLTPQTRIGSKANNAPELDHRIPLSIGGNHDYSNVQCACRECNAKK